MRHAHTTKALGVLHRSGYATGGKVHEDAAADRVMMTKAVHQHEMHDHKGEKLTKLHLARGGAAKHKGTHVNVIVAPQGGMGARPVPVPVPAAGGAPVGGPAMARPPMAPPMNVPPGAVGMRPPGMKRGGGVHGGPAMSEAHNIKPRRKDTPTANKDEYLMKTEAKRGGAIRRADGGTVPAIYKGRGDAIKEMGEEAERRNYAPRQPSSDSGPTRAKRGGAIKRMKGGYVSPPMKAGAGGGLGRLEKIKAYGKGAR